VQPMQPPGGDGVATGQDSQGATGAPLPTGTDTSLAEPAPIDVRPPAKGAEQLAVTADLEALGAIERDFDDVDTALRRLDDGTYWTCESCGGAIDEGLLADGPLTRRCRRCGPPDAAA
jgi:hypothetical protein